MSGPKSHSYGLVEGGGALAVGAGVTGLGLAKASYSIGLTARGVLNGGNTLGDLATSVKQSIPLIGKDAGWAEARKAVAAGAIAAVGGPILRKIPLIRKVARMSVKIDKKTRIRVA